MYITRISIRVAYCFSQTILFEKEKLLAFAEVFNLTITDKKVPEHFLVVRNISTIIYDSEQLPD